MPTVLTSSQQTFVDITDQRKLSAYITSNLPKSQIEDPNVLPHTYAPDWASTPLTLTPVVFLDQTNLALDASGLTISWKRKEGNGAEAALTSGESVSKGVLTVNANKLAAATSGMLTYLCYISYYDSETKNTVNISADITYTGKTSSQKGASRTKGKNRCTMRRVPTRLSLIWIPSTGCRRRFSAEQSISQARMETNPLRDIRLPAW